MLAGCSGSALLSSPRHRLRRETSAQFPVRHLPLSSTTQRSEFPSSFSRKETPRRQPVRPNGVSVDKPVESKSITCCSINDNVRLPRLEAIEQTAFSDRKIEFWETGKSRKRFLETGLADDELCIHRVKRKKGGDNQRDDDRLSLVQIGSGDIWFSRVGVSVRCLPDDKNVPYVPPFPCFDNPWVGSVITEITNVAGKDVGTSYRLVNEHSGSSASLESSNLGLKLNESAPDLEVGNERTWSPSQHRVSGTTEGVVAVNNNEIEKLDFELVNLLIGCVEAISSKNIAAVHYFLAKLGDLASPTGSHRPLQRLTAYYTEALAIRVTKLWPNIFCINIPPVCNQTDDDDEPGTALRVLNDVTPIPKFIHFTANEMLVRAFEGKDKVHVIDFDVKQGLQWPSFFHSLASRNNPPSHVRLTGIGESKQELNETGIRLRGFAEALNLSFEFHPVVDRLEDVRLWMLHVKEGESVAVNCIFQLHKTLHDENGAAFRDFAGVIRSTNPIMVVMAEQEAEHDFLDLETRVCNSLKYYSAIFDSIDSAFPSLDNPVRVKIEETFAHEIRNIIACEGINRSERHHCFEKWKMLMEDQGGFQCLHVTERDSLQSQMLLRMYSNRYYNVMEQEHDGVTGALTLCWSDQPLYSVSAWTPVDVAASSSEFSRPI